MAGFNMGDTSFTIPMSVASGENCKNIYFMITDVYLSLYILQAKMY